MDLSRQRLTKGILASGRNPAGTLSAERLAFLTLPACNFMRWGRRGRGSERLRHHDAMALDSRLEWDGGMELLGTGFDVAVFAIDGRELGTEAEDGHVYGFAALAAEMILGGLDDNAPEACTLILRGDSELAEIAAGASHFCVDTAEKLASRVFGHKDSSLLHHGSKTDFVRACAFKKDFDREGGVDEGNQALPVGFNRQAEMERRVGVSVPGHFYSSMET